MKKLLSAALVCAMLVSVLALLPVSAAQYPNGLTDPSNASDATTYSALKGTPVVDGVVDEIWSTARKAKLDQVVGGDSRDASAVNSNDVTFSVMYDSERVYVLIEIWDDEYYPDVHSQDWKNDRIFIYFSENGHNTGYTAGKSWQWDLPLGQDDKETINYRQANRGHYGETDEKAGITTPAPVRKTTFSNDNHNITIELSFSIQQDTLKKQHGVDKISESMIAAIDVQYHDVDSTYAGEAANANPRTIVRYWGSRNNNGNPTSPADKRWGRLKFTTEVAVSKATVEVDGTVDALWENVSSVTLGNIVQFNSNGTEWNNGGDDSKISSESRNPSLVDSSSVTVKTVYDDSKVYMLFEIEDDDYASYVAEDGSNPEGWSDWKDDSIVILLAEDPDYGSKAGDAAYYAKHKTYMIVAYPSEKGAYVRNNAGEDMKLEHAYRRTGNDDDGYKYVIELSLELNYVENAAGSYFWADFQYNDANPEYPVTENTRDIVRNWQSGILGTTQNRVLGQFKMVATEVETPVKHPENWETSINGKLDIIAMDNVTVLATVDYDNTTGTLTAGNDSYKVRGTLAEDNIVILDKDNNQVGTVTQGRFGINVSLGKLQGTLVPHTEPAPEPVLTVGDNSFDVPASGMTVTFTAPKAGKYTIAWGEGEKNGEAVIETASGSDTIALPVTVELDAGESYSFILYTLDWQADEIDVSVSAVEDIPVTGDATLFIVLASVLSLGVAVVALKRRQSVR